MGSQVDELEALFNQEEECLPRMTNLRKRMQLLHRVIERQRVDQITLSQSKKLVTCVSQLLVSIAALKQFAVTHDEPVFKGILESCENKIKKTLRTLKEKLN